MTLGIWWIFVIKPLIYCYNLRSSISSLMILKLTWHRLLEYNNIWNRFLANWGQMVLTIILINRTEFLTSPCLLFYGRWLLERNRHLWIITYPHVLQNIIHSNRDWMEVVGLDFNFIITQPWWAVFIPPPSYSDLLLLRLINIRIIQQQQET